MTYESTLREIDRALGFRKGHLIRTPCMSPEEALHGLAPSLVINLAELSADDPRDLAVTIQLMPFGDRTVLLAYGAISYDRRRGVVIQPFFHELARAALTEVCNWARSSGF